MKRHSRGWRPEGPCGERVPCQVAQNQVGAVGKKRLAEVQMLSTKVGFHSQGSGTAAKGFNMAGFSKTEKVVCEEGRPGLGRGGGYL